MKYKELILINDIITLPSKINKTLKNDAFDWLNQAEFDNAIIEIDEKQNVIWHMGTWYNGHWHGDVWLDGIWNNGYWHQGEWYNGLWRNGTWLNGTWHNGIWKKGIWKSGEKEKSYSLTI